MYRSKKLKKFFEIKHYFFSRKNGYSKGLYKGLNCGRGSKDNKKNIAKNLEFVSKKMRVKKNNLILIKDSLTNCSNLLSFDSLFFGTVKQSS